MLNEHADPAFKRTQNGAVQHHGNLARIVFGNVLGSQAAGHLEVDLHRTALPGTTQAVLEVVFDLRTVESAFARQNLIRQSAGIKRSDQSGLGLVPDGIFADAHFRTRGNLVKDVVKAERVVDVAHDAGEVHAFLQNLIFGAEDVTVVLRKAANAHQAVQSARRFIAVALTEFAVAKRQIAVAAQSRIEELDVARAVHGL